MNDVDVAAVRARLKAIDPQRTYSTHWEGCYTDHHRSHDLCAITALLAALDQQQREIAKHLDAVLRQDEQVRRMSIRNQTLAADLAAAKAATNQEAIRLAELAERPLRNRIDELLEEVRAAEQERDEARSQVVLLLARIDAEGTMP